MSEGVPGNPGSGATREADDAELRRRVTELGGEAAAEMTRAELQAALHLRRAMIESLDAGALLDLAVWAGLDPARRPGPEETVRVVLARGTDRLAELSERGLRALARVRGLPVTEEDTRERLVQRLTHPRSWREMWRRQRRRVIGSVLSRMLHDDEPAPAQGPPPAGAPSPSLRAEIERQGVVGGIARKIRGAADDYVAEKLDEIEQRIDHKLEEIDQRLSEWRDREVANRLRILRLTLVFAVLVAALSLGYDYLRWRLHPAGEARPVNTAARVAEPAGEPAAETKSTP